MSPRNENPLRPVVVLESDDFIWLIRAGGELSAAMYALRQTLPSDSPTAAYASNAANVLLDHIDGMLTVMVRADEVKPDPSRLCRQLRE